LLEKPSFLYDIYGNCVAQVEGLLESSEDDAKKYFDEWELRLKNRLFVAEYINRHYPESKSAGAVKSTIRNVYVSLNFNVSSAKRFLEASFSDNQDILKNDARLDLLAYTQEGTGASDEEIAVKSLAKIYEGLSKKVGSIEYATAVLSIVKGGNIDFLAGVKLDKYASVAKDYLTAITLFQDFTCIVGRQGRTSAIDKSGIEMSKKIEEMKTELGKFKGLK
jgi:hypothetical protein